jgi:hypothetical protein
MIDQFRAAISVKAAQTAVRAAIGVIEQYHATAGMQATREADLIENKIALAISRWRGQILCAPRDDDQIRVGDRLALQKLAHRKTNPMIETAEYGGIGDISLRGRVEMKDFAHWAPVVCR